jgi:nucleotide-binding universal stress UspA family protein
MKTQINSLLIPTDFSELSNSALKVGIAIAKRQGADITLVHVLDRFAYLQPTEVFLPDFKITPDILHSTKKNLKALTSRIHSQTGIKTTGKVLYGTPSDAICQFAYEKNFSLIVMGTHGVSGIREFFIGSEAFRVVKNATCPVLTIPGRWGKTDFKKVLFPIRLDPEALEKYFYARPIIECNNSELFILGLTEKNKKSNKKEIEMLADKLKLQLYINNVVFHSAIYESDDFSAKVIETANEYEADLIILTANLDYNFKAFFLGPYVQQVINHSKRPVLSIKPDSSQIDKEKSYVIANKWEEQLNLQNFDFKFI